MRVITDNGGMRSLRHFSTIARLVLAWFVLSLGVAVASPLVQPRDVVFVCHGSGVLQVTLTDDEGGTDSTPVPKLDCPLCLSVALMPAPEVPTVAPAHPLAYALQGIPAAILAARTAAPLPARGPPTQA